MNAPAIGQRGAILHPIKAGETKTLDLAIPVGAIARADEEGNLVVFPGTYTLTVDYDGKIPVTFELTVLGASLCAVFGMLALNRLPHPHHPVFNVHRFKHASSDRFFLCIESNDAKFHVEECARFLHDLHAHHVTEVAND